MKVAERTGPQGLARKVQKLSLPEPAGLPTRIERCATACGGGLWAVVASVTDALRTYEACIGASRGHSQCSAEFDELDGAHHDFEDAVAEYRQACPPAPLEPR